MQRTFCPTVHILNTPKGICVFDNYDSLKTYTDKNLDVVGEIEKHAINQHAVSNCTPFVITFKNDKPIAITSMEVTKLELNQEVVFAKNMLEALSFVEAPDTNKPDLYVPPRKQEPKGKGGPPPREFDDSILKDSDVVEIPITLALKLATLAPYGAKHIMSKEIQATEELAKLVPRFLCWKLGFATLTKLMTKTNVEVRRNVMHTANQGGFIYLPTKLLDMYPLRESWA